MTVHMIRIFCENPPGLTILDIDLVVQDWINTHTEWLDDPVAHEITPRESDDGTVFLGGDFRFAIADLKTALLDTLELSLQPEVSWYRIGYHQCVHDEPDRGGCSWDDQREYNPQEIPASIPTFL